MKAIITLFLIAATSLTSDRSKISNAALARTNHNVTYTPDYVKIAYPMGDVPPQTGVCTDVLIRTLRNAIDWDLQALIHNDIKANFHAYPSQRIWGLNRPDANIDHRRTQNIQCYLKRHGYQEKITNNAEDYLPGDIVFFDLASGHVGIVVDRKQGGTPLIVHNIGGGPILDNCLFSYTITGHYRIVKN